MAIRLNVNLPDVNWMWTDVRKKKKREPDDFATMQQLSMQMRILWFNSDFMLFVWTVSVAFETLRWHILSRKWNIKQLNFRMPCISRRDIYFFPSAEIIFPTDGIVAVFAYESTPLIFFTGKFSTFCPLSYSRFKCQFRFEHLLKHIFIDKSPLWEYVSLSFKIHALKFPYASKSSEIISSHNAQNSNYLYFSKAIKKFVDFLLNSS